VRQFVDAINSGDEAALDGLCSRELAAKLKVDFAEFRGAFPDWRMETVELVGEHAVVVARFRCSGTHQGWWQGLPPQGKPMRVEEVYFFRIHDGRITDLWALEDTWTRMQQLSNSD
jgi:predicted ester cyclase